MKNEEINKGIEDNKDQSNSAISKRSAVAWSTFFLTLQLLPLLYLKDQVNENTPLFGEEDLPSPNLSIADLESPFFANKVFINEELSKIDLLNKYISFNDNSSMLDQLRNYCRSTVNSSNLSVVRENKTDRSFIKIQTENTELSITLTYIASELISINITETNEFGNTMQYYISTYFEQYVEKEFSNKNFNCKIGNQMDTDYNQQLWLRQGINYEVLTEAQYNEIEKYLVDLFKNNGVGSYDELDGMITSEKVKILAKK